MKMSNAPKRNINNPNNLVIIIPLSLENFGQKILRKNLARYTIIAPIPTNIIPKQIFNINLLTSPLHKSYIH